MTATQLTFLDPLGDLFGQPVHVYTRAQAIEACPERRRRDGALVDVSETAKEVGFRLPMAITEALYNCLTPTHADQAIGQDYDGRLWDVLWVAAFAIKLADPSAGSGLRLRAGPGTDTVTFTVGQQEVEAKSGQPGKVDLRLRAVCSPGDEGEPVVTIGFPEDF